MRRYLKNANIPDLRFRSHKASTHDVVALLKKLKANAGSPNLALGVTTESRV